MSSENSFCTSDSSFCQILVYILDNGSEKQTELLRKKFDNPLFVTYTVDVTDVPGDCVTPAQQDAYKYNVCLKDAQARSETSSAIVIKADSTSDFTAHEISRLILLACNCETSWDLCYLTVYNDLCSKYTEVARSQAYPVVICKTVAPEGDQAIMFSPAGRDYFLSANLKTSPSEFLSKSVRDDKLTAICFLPNLFYAFGHKYKRCLAEPGLDGECCSWAYWFWLIFFVVVLILLLAFAYKNRDTCLDYCKKYY